VGGRGGLLTNSLQSVYQLVDSTRSTAHSAENGQVRKLGLYVQTYPSAYLRPVVEINGSRSTLELASSRSAAVDTQYGHKKQTGLRPASLYLARLYYHSHACRHADGCLVPCRWSAGHGQVTETAFTSGKKLNERRF
jgi:hypothetical protein